jgi:hypothetical protein
MANNNKMFQRLAALNPSLDHLHLSINPIAFDSPTFCQDVDEFVQEASETIHHFVNGLRTMKIEPIQSAYSDMRSDVDDAINRTIVLFALLKVFARSVTAAANPSDRIEAILTIQATEREIEKSILACDKVVAHLGN